MHPDHDPRGPHEPGCVLDVYHTGQCSPDIHENIRPRWNEEGANVEKPYAAAKLLWELVYRDLAPYFIDELNLIDAVDEVIRRIRKETEENLP